MKVASINFYVFNKQPDKDLERIKEMDLDVIGFQEMYRHLGKAKATLTNHRVFWGNQNTDGAREVASAVHKRYKVLGTGAREVSSASASEQTKIFKSRWITIVRFKNSSGTKFAHINYHGNAVLQDKKTGNLATRYLRVVRWMAAQQIIERRIKRLKRRGFKILVTGDFNYRNMSRRLEKFRLAYLSPQKMFQRCGLAYVEHGLDYVAHSEELPRQSVEIIKKETQGADHDWLVVTVGKKRPTRR